MSYHTELLAVSRATAAQPPLDQEWDEMGRTLIRLGTRVGHFEETEDERTPLRHMLTEMGQRYLDRPRCAQARRFLAVCVAQLADAADLLERRCDQLVREHWHSALTEWDMRSDAGVRVMQ